MEIWCFQGDKKVKEKSCNLTIISFGLYLRHKIFPKYRTCTGTQQIISIFIIEQIKWKFITNFFFKFKKSYSWPIFGPFPQFWGQKKFSNITGSVMHYLIKVSSTMPKFRETQWSHSKKKPRQMPGHKNK